MTRTPFALVKNLCSNAGKYFAFFAFFLRLERTLEVVHIYLFQSIFFFFLANLDLNFNRYCKSFNFIMTLVSYCDLQREIVTYFNIICAQNFSIQ